MKQQEDWRTMLEEDMKVNFGKSLGIGARLKTPLYRLLYLLRRTHALYTKSHKTLREKILFNLYKKLYTYYMRRFCLDISYKTTIGKGLKLPHPMGIVIHGKTVIGNYCTIMQHVTLGNRSEQTKNDLPVIRSHVYIGAGAKILGACMVGEGSQIGANAVVVQDIPSGASAVGVPARIIAYKKEYFHDQT